MPDLPTGTITFLFTDIEGSTTRWEHQTQAMQGALARHDALMRQAIGAHAGVVFKTVGDAFYAAFENAADAFQAALAAQRALQDEDWGEVIGPLRVRMALHTGTPEARDNDYFGPPLNRVARVLNAGHGGQVLLSTATAELVRDRLPPEIGLADMGEHRLKDLVRSERIFQITAPWLARDFAPLRTLDSRPHNLPAYRDPLVGREREVAEIVEMLLRPTIGLVTLTGPGGIGKTRLSLQVAAELLDDFADGVFLVELAAISDPALVAPTIATTLGVTERTGSLPLDTLKTFLREKQLLLVLDNFEQLTPAAPLITELLRAAPRIKVLVSSREVLYLSEDHNYLVPPLALPDPAQPVPLEQLAQYAAVTLFTQRAQEVRPDFQITEATAAAVAAICVALDGLPLAIELAAARIKVFPPQTLLARLDRRLKVLTSGSRDLTARQQTLRGAIDWSHQLLSATEQRLFARMAIFVGGASLQAAEAVCTLEHDQDLDVLEGIQSLLDKSLLRLQEQAGEEPRFSMIETIREYAQERLNASDEAETLRRQHATYFLALAETAIPGQGARLRRLAAEYGNLRLALTWALEHHETTLGLRLAGALTGLWETRGPLSEGRRLIEAAVAQAEPIASPPLLRALTGAGRLAGMQGAYAQALDWHANALDIARQLCDQASIAFALNNMGVQAANLADLPRARDYYAESLALYRVLDDRQGVEIALLNLGAAAFDQVDWEPTPTMLQESLGLWRELQDPQRIAMVRGNLGFLRRYQGDDARAVALYRESLRLSRDAGDQFGIVASLEDLAAATAGWTRWRGLATNVPASDAAERAARLLSIAAGLRVRLDVALSAGDEIERDEFLTALRLCLGEAAFAALWANGQSMPVEQAVEYALEEPARD